MTILILCTGNSARSQMAEGLLKSMDPSLDVRSAGTQPALRVHPAAIEAMGEIGIDISTNRPKHVDTTSPVDFLITVCDHAHETCPVFSGPVRYRLQIGFPDPAAVLGTDTEVLEAFRVVRAAIKGRFEILRHNTLSAVLQPATAADLEPASALLTECDLPLDGLTDQFGGNYVLARNANSLSAMAGIEVYGPNGLLRSVAVAPAMRDSHLGSLVVQDRFHWAKMQNLDSVYLLTTTAAPYFARHGFEAVARDEAPAGIRSSPEFAHACPASATFMRRRM